MRAAVVEDGVVKNIIVVDDLSFEIGIGELVSIEGQEAGIGWSYIDGEFFPPGSRDEGAD